MKTHLKFFASAAALGIPMFAAAQATSPASNDSIPASSSLRYESAFADYKPYSDIKTGDWKAMNNAVGNAGGGHTGHAMATNPPAAGAP